MSEISLAQIFHHEHIPHAPQLSIAGNNATVLSFKGKDISKAKIANRATTPKKGFRNRVECGVTENRSATKFAV